MHFVYIIHSSMANRYYVGESAFPENRIVEHNSGKYPNASTKIAVDWSLKRLVKCENRANALKVERYIKSMKSSRFTEQLISDNLFYDRFKKIVLQKFLITIH